MAKGRKRGGNCYSCGRFVHKNGNCATCIVCPCCHGLYLPEKSCPRCNIHHSHPRSRGGKDTNSNLILMRRDIHDAWHTLHANLCVQEVVICALYDWDNFCPYAEEERREISKNRLKKRKKAWDKVYGKQAKQKDVIKKVIIQFTKLPGDKEAVKLKLREALRNKFITKSDFNYFCRLLEYGEEND